MVNGFNCSYMASEDTEDLLNQRVGAYVLAVETMKTVRKQFLPRMWGFPMCLLEL